MLNISGECSPDAAYFHAESDPGCTSLYYIVSFHFFSGTKNFSWPSCRTSSYTYFTGNLDGTFTKTWGFADIIPWNPLTGPTTRRIATLKMEKVQDPNFNPLMVYKFHLKITYLAVFLLPEDTRISQIINTLRWSNFCLETNDTMQAPQYFPPVRRLSYICFLKKEKLVGETGRKLQITWIYFKYDLKTPFSIHSPCRTKLSICAAIFFKASLNYLILNYLLFII